MKRFLLHWFLGLMVGVGLFACASSPEPAPEQPAEATAAIGEGAIATKVVSAVATELAPPSPVPTQMVPLFQNAAIAETRMLTLEYPPTIRAGDSDVVRLTLEVDDAGNITPTAVIDGNVVEGGVINIPNVFDSHNVLAQARLDMAGMQVQPSGEISEPLRPEQSATFYWSLRPEDVGNYRGTVWFYLMYVPLDGSPSTRQAVSAQFIEIEATTFMGLRAVPARIAGVVGTAIGSVLGMPFVEEILKWLWRRIKRK